MRLLAVMILQIFYCIYSTEAAPQGPDFKGLDPNNKPGRFVDRILCPKNEIGEYTRNKSFCHRAHMGWHKLSEIVDLIFGGTGQFDRERYAAHLDGLKASL